MVLSEAVVEAARAGNVATVEQWLRAGGDANERRQHVACRTSRERPFGARFYFLLIHFQFASSRTRGFCGRGSGKFLPFARCVIAGGRRPLPRRPRHLRGSSAPRRPLSLRRARPPESEQEPEPEPARRSGRRRASPTRSPTSSASSGWEALRAGRNVPRHARASKNDAVAA